MRNTSATKLTNPFVGLRAFEENEDYLFFGRSTQISELLRILSQSRFLAVIGSSGSGKSSLVKSGLLPAIYSGFMTVGSNWRAVSMRPGEDPVGYLTKALATEGVLYTGVQNSEVPYDLIIETSLRRSENGLVQVYKDAHLPPKENLLIVVDQFEELFRFSRYEKEARLGKSDAIHFIQILLAAAQQKECPIYVLLTMRADFLGDCAEFRGLPEAINEGQYLIPRMKRDEIREAITGPVAVSGATISQRLVTRLLNDLNNDTDQLPILQHAMMRTWDAWFQRNRHNDPIDFEDYERIGTMKEALSLHADEAYAELSKDGEQRTCELMFKALTDKAADVRGIRRPRSVADLCVLANASESRVKHVVEVFRRPGRTFLMPPPRVPLTEHSIIDISHESLMRVWDRLVKWIDEEARSGDVYLRLANSAQLHDQGQRGLLKNPELEIALRWKEQNHPTAKWAEGYKADFDQATVYLEESRKADLAEQKVLADREATRKRLVRTVIFLLAALVIAGIVISIKLNGLRREAEAQTREAQRQKQEAERQKEEANRQKAKADVERGNALVAFAQAKKSDSESKVSLQIAIRNKEIADEKQREAAHNAEVAKQQTAIAVTEKENATRLLATTQAQNRKIAANEYARLIREGPSEENNNKETFYPNNYFLTYAYHFNRLEKLVSPDDKASYEALKNKLYYNNDLYRRIYEDFGDKYRDEVVKEVNLPAPDLFSKQLDENTNVTFEKTEGARNAINLSGNGKKNQYVLSKKGREFLALAVSRKQDLVFCSTNDNLIYVFNHRLQPVDTINLGARVTALDFFDGDNKSIIYFGTASGYIGYITYDRQKKLQPVFENKLETEIKTVQLFQRSARGNAANDDSGTFLLAVAAGSNPRVYKLDNNSLKPDKLLLGNELPYRRQDYGRIAGGRYEANHVLLFTEKGTYAWNPFSGELLTRLNTIKGFTPNSKPVNDLRYYTE